MLRDEDGGRWILSSDHSEAACELPITWVDDQGTVRDSILDRTFVEAKSGERWIIDYKTSVPLENESLDEFSSRELAHYREQLTAYGTAMSGLDQRPIRCALYFTGVGHLAPLHP